MKLLIICGGPSFERDISLNSARSVYDNIIKREGLEIEIIFVDLQCEKHIVSGEFLYSNTTSDFDFKLATEGKKLTEQEFIDEILTCDLVFPILHGVYGENGEIQQILERLNVPFVGSNSYSCQKMYNKEKADYKLLKANGFYTIPKLYIRKGDSNSGMKIRRFFAEYDLESVVLKPIEGGSSIGVVFAENAESATEQIHKHLENYGEIIIEPICKGREFTVIILQNKQGKPVALMPTEIEISHNDGEKLFNKRRKYLATTETHYYCPARFDDEIIAKIRSRAQELFTIAGANDFLRIDGWLLDDGNIYFSDFNPISGMEQNSFIFQQGAKVGFSHSQLIEYILGSACRRQWLELPPIKEENKGKKRVNVLMGGWTSERQVSLMSGTNVWRKLANSDKFEPVPYLLYKAENKPMVREIPYSMALNHTVEEILFQMAEDRGQRTDVFDIREKLGVIDEAPCSMDVLDEMGIDEFIEMTKKQEADVFIGLHGGYGENGDLQEKLEQADIHFNGSGSIASKLCMDKYKTGEVVDSLKREKLRTCKKELVNINALSSALCPLPSVCKPNDDGCSTGVVIIKTEEQFKKYIDILRNKETFVPAGTFERQSENIQISLRDEFLVEEFIDVDELLVENKELKYTQKTGWVELTVGVLEKNGEYHSLNPSITVASSGILSLEEKFQGGTGINITPPPESVISAELCDKIKADVEAVAKVAGVEDYCRIDVFANNITNEVIIIEINTLPGLSPSTVLFQQGAKEQPPIMPRELLEKIIS